MIKIEITVDMNTSPKEYDDQLQLIGLQRVATVNDARNFLRATAGYDATIENKTEDRGGELQPGASTDVAGIRVTNHSDETVFLDPSAGVGAFPAGLSVEQSAAMAPARTPGQPGEGRKRRTKEEMQEDRAHFGTEDGNPPQPTVIGGEPTTGAAISQGDQRPDPETEALDRADEARERARTGDGKLTRDDLRNVLGEWTRKVGFATASKRTPEVLGCPMLEIPETQEAMAEAIAKIRAEIDGGTTPVSVAAASVAAANEELFGGASEAQPAKVYGLDDVKAAVGAYAQKYDGHTDMRASVIAGEDAKKLFKEAIGVDKPAASVWADPENCRKAVEAIERAITANPFKRDAKG